MYTCRDAGDLTRRCDDVCLYLQVPVQVHMRVRVYEYVPRARARDIVHVHVISCTRMCICTCMCMRVCCQALCHGAGREVRLGSRAGCDVSSTVEQMCT